MIMQQRIALLMTGISLGGCATYSDIGREMGVNADIVRAKLGEPAHRYQREDAEIWEYDHGPYSWYGYHFEFNSDRALTRVVQTRTEQNAKNVVPHVSTEEDVKAIIGWPVRTYRIRDNTIWEWPSINYVGLPARLVVQFSGDGTVSEVATYPLPTGSCCRRWK